MTRLNTRYNWGETLSDDNPDLFRQLSDVYGDIAQVSNGKTNKAIMTSDPQANSDVNKNYDIGDIWVNTSSDTAWILTSRSTAEIVTWTQIT